MTRDPNSNLFRFKFYSAKKIVYTEHPCCGTRTGIHLCCKSQRQTDLSPYGVGISLYFQFLKHMVYLFFLCTLFSLPSYMFFFSGNSAGKQLDLSNIKNVLTAFSLANIGQCKNF